MVAVCLGIGSAGPSTAHAALETAGELLVDLDGCDPTAGDVEWANHGTLGDFVRIGNPAVEEIDGLGAVTFNGTTGGDAYQCREPVPHSFVVPDAPRSIEVWAYNPELSPEETMVAWGCRGGPDGTNMSFNFGDSPVCGAVTHWGQELDLPWRAGAPPIAGAWHYLVFTYDGTTARLYCDGVLEAEREIGPGRIDTHDGTPITLAAQIASDGVGLDQAPSRMGTLSLARVRVHNGVLTSGQISLNCSHTQGVVPGRWGTTPRYVNEWCLPRIRNAPAEDYVREGDTAYARRITVRSLRPLTLAVLEPTGASIDQDGLLTYSLPAPARAPFTVTVSATNEVGTVSAAWIVRETRASPLRRAPVHRYSFSDDARDALGAAHGIPYGGVAFTDGRAALGNDGSQSIGPGCFPDPHHPDKPPPGAYIDLPNGIVSGLDNQATFAMWVTWDGPAETAGQRIFDFGGDLNSEDCSYGDGYCQFMLTPRSDAGTMRFQYRFGIPHSFGERRLETEPLAPGAEHHVVVVWDGETASVSLYVDGRRCAQDLAEDYYPLSHFNDANIWLGRPQSPCPMFCGSYNEFRVHDYALGYSEVIGTFEAGPDILPLVHLDDLFFRGDSNVSGAVDIADAVFALSYLFAKGKVPDCLDAADANDSGAVDIADAIAILSHLFAAAGPLPQPFEECGIDPTLDDLDCLSYPHCEGP